MLLTGIAACNTGGGDETAEAEEVGFDGETEAEYDNARNEIGFDRFNQRDLDKDERWNEAEFETVADEAGFYEEWDADDDNYLSDDELYEGVYGVYDEDDDNVLTNEEFDAWNTAWGGAYDYDTWDLNDDNALDYEEYRAGVEQAGIYEDWDMDNDDLYAENEVYAGLYDTWDVNDDEYLDTEEYEDFDYNLWGL